MKSSWWAQLWCSLGLHRWQIPAEPAQREAEHFQPYRNMRCRRCGKRTTQLHWGARQPEKRGRLCAGRADEDHD